MRPGIRERAIPVAGFTLVEIVIAAAILTIAGLALAAAVAQGHDLSQVPREEAAARNAIRSCLAEIAARRFDQVAQSYHGRGFPVESLRAVRTDPDGLPGEIEIAYGPGDDRSFYTVTVRVRWAGLHGERVIETVSYLANVRGDTGTPVPLEEIPITGQPIDSAVRDGTVAGGGA
jgi:type II secretory pathway pseudopilin PulG